MSGQDWGPGAPPPGWQGQPGPPPAWQGQPGWQAPPPGPPPPQRGPALAIVITLVVVLLVAGGAVAAFLALRPEAGPEPVPAPAPEEFAAAGCGAVERQPDLGGGHIPSVAETLATTVPGELYPDRPATSGPHVGQVAAGGFYDEPVDERLLVHNLEHGYVVLWYDDAAGTADALRAWVDGEVASGRPKVVAAPAYDDELLGGGGVALTAWFQRQACEAFDPAVASAFVGAHHGTAGEAPERTIVAHQPGMQGVLAAGDALLFPPLDGTAVTADTSEDPDPGGGGNGGTAPDGRPVACGADVPLTGGTPRAYPDGPDAVTEPGTDYQAVIETSCGTLVVELLADDAPETVNSFAFLAGEGFFDGLEIFRDAEGIAALQTGAGTNEATWDIGYELTDELAVAQAEGYPAGTLAMANAGPNSAGSQFFFVYGPEFDAAFPQELRTYTVFGRVVEGLDVLEQLGAVPAGDPGGETPQEAIYLESVRVTPV